MWEININDQIATFLWSLVLGVAVCLLYDIFRALRTAVKHGAAAVFAEDIFFWLLAAFMNFVFLMGRTGGGLRGYVFVGEIIGFWTLRFTLSRGFVFILSRIIGFFAKLHRTVSGKSADFLWLTGRFSVKFFTFLIKNLKRVKKLLKSRDKLLYTKANNDGEDSDVC